ncbi:MAG: hypothetical protein J1D77_07370 [Muribaculaceae bacterium]|nr:hypothetical protein [Muribaculaceae bacterium]
MVSTVRYIFFFSLIFLLGCGKAEFSLNFNLAESVEGNYNVVYYATDTQGGLTVQATASVREGKCLLNGATKLPTLISITSRHSKLPLVVYAKRGDKIEITGSDDNPLGWDVEGDPLNLLLSSWRHENLTTLLSDSTDSINAAVARFVETNPKDPASTILMLYYFNRNEQPREYADLMASLRGEARSDKWLRITARADQTFNTFSYPARLVNMVMRANTGGIDTLSIDGKNPLLLLFWQTGYNEKKAMIDSLKALNKELADSVRIIADICLDPDSASWRSAIRKDSLEGVKRFWVPTSLADPTVMKFNVPSIPYFIVFDKDGRQTFRGQQLEEALKSYRSLVNSKDS